MTVPVSYRTDLEDVDWQELKKTLRQDNFDNGRTPEQLERSFRSSARAVLAFDPQGRVIGTARALSDGVFNAYVVDVWTHSAARGQGIGSEMMRRLVEDLWGQHVYLFTDDAVAFYHKLGYQERGVGMEKVIGQWLQDQPPA